MSYYFEKLKKKGFSKVDVTEYIRCVKQYGILAKIEVNCNCYIIRNDGI